MNKEYLERTPLIIRFSEAVVVDESNKIKFSDFKLKITPPSTVYKYPIQTLKYPKDIKVPSNGVLKLKLYPSSIKGDYITGRYNYYKVEVYNKNLSLPIDIWYWDIPQTSISKSIVINYTPPSYTLPSDFFELINTLDETYTIENNKLIIDGITDGESKKIKLDYKVGLTLNEVTVGRYGSISTNKERFYRF